MKNGFKAMDSDMHVMEPCDLWQKYIDKKFLDRAPVGLNRHKRDLGVQVDGKIMPRPTPKPIPGSDRSARRFSMNVIPKKKRATSTTSPKSAPWTKKVSTWRYFIQAAACSCSPSTGSIRNWPPPLPKPTTTGCTTSAKSRPIACTAPALSRRTMFLRRSKKPAAVVKDLGFRSVLVRPNHVNGRMWSDPYYDPLWEECQKLEIPIGFHEAGRVYLPQPALHEFIPSFAMFNTLSFPMANMFACADMIYGGVMERFPKLKVAFLEGNCAWLPWLLWRMDEYAELTGAAEHPEMKLKPLEYFQRQCWGAVECDEAVAKIIPDFGLEDNIVFSTDYPHLDVKYPHAVETFLKLPFSDQTKRKYLWDNCARLYGFGY